MAIVPNILNGLSGQRNMAPPLSHRINTKRGWNEKAQLFGFACDQPFEGEMLLR